MKAVIRSIRDRDWFIDTIKRINIDKPFTAIFEPQKKKRSPNQNRWIHWWFNLLESETGTSAEAWKEHYKKKFLITYKGICFGEEVGVIQKTRELNTTELNEFCDRIHEDALEQGILLPYPNEPGWDEFCLKYGG